MYYDVLMIVYYAILTVFVFRIIDFEILYLPLYNVHEDMPWDSS